MASPPSLFVILRAPRRAPHGITCRRSRRGCFRYSLGRRPTSRPREAVRRFARPDCRTTLASLALGRSLRQDSVSRCGLLSHAKRRASLPLLALAQSGLMLGLRRLVSRGMPMCSQIGVFRPGRGSDSGQCRSVASAREACVTMRSLAGSWPRRAAAFSWRAREVSPKAQVSFSFDRRCSLLLAGGAHGNALASQGRPCTRRCPARLMG